MTINQYPLNKVPINSASSGSIVGSFSGQVLGVSQQIRTLYTGPLLGITQNVGYLATGNNLSIQIEQIVKVAQPSTPILKITQLIISP